MMGLFIPVFEMYIVSDTGKTNNEVEGVCQLGNNVHLSNVS